MSAKGIEKAIKYAEWDKIELEADGKIKGANEHLTNIREEWADYVSTSKTLVAGVENPPVISGGTTVTKESIMAINDPVERQTAIAKNIELFKGKE